MPKRKLSQYIIDVLDGKDDEILQLSKDLNTKERYRILIERLNMTEQTFAATLSRICDFLFSNKCGCRGYYASLLTFSIELDTFHTKNSPWYSRDMLVETLVIIFLKTKYTRGGQEGGYLEYIWISSILLIIIAFILL